MSSSAGAAISSPSLSSSSSSSSSSPYPVSPLAAHPSPVAAAAASAASAYYYRSSPRQQDDWDWDDDGRRRGRFRGHLKPQSHQQSTSSSYSSSTSSVPPLLLLLLALLTAIPAVLVPSARYRSLNADILSLHASYVRDRARLDTLRAELEGARIRSSELTRDVRRAERRREGLILGLHDEIEKAKKAKRAAEQTSENGGEWKEGEEEDADVDVAAELEELQPEVRRRVASRVAGRYGEGPHRLRFDVRFLGPAGKPTDNPLDSASFTVQLADPESMPHTVHHFLTSAAELRLWDGTAFVHHSEGIVTAVPTDYRTAHSVRDRFDRSGMAQLAVEEATSEALRAAMMGHSYVLCFGGGGGQASEFYIKMTDGDYDSLTTPAGRDDNRGDRDDGTETEEDTCFARVVRGYDAVDRIAQRGAIAEERRRINVVGIDNVTFLPKMQQRGGGSGGGGGSGAEEEDVVEEEKAAHPPKIEWSIGRVAVGADGMPL